ncbi:hypothetical protein [Paenibacillus ginsengarvi]|uniref:Uncharacterized protein n=1 Tax=Paenibacillus ginsengarvi TaxID=400777 RepID=A0A3B0AHM2_9BACL|nr:hypothetical protein [Paenibacillus ginsengarvi]RKN60050.1 hypothetical protein D7M11_35945 [Paenibacillus ginsengarvi]
MTNAMPSKKRIVIGHMLRWCVIVIAVLYLLRVLYGANPWSLESVTRQALSSMELPEVSVTSVVDSGQGIRLVLLVDRQHAMIHHFFISRPFGILWQNRGGGYGMPIDPEVRIDFRGGMSTFGHYRHYYYIGQVHDPKITTIKVTWQDGYVQNAALTEGVYLVTRSIRISDDDQSQTMTPRMLAYDQEGVQLYNLTPEQREARSQR